MQIAWAMRRMGEGLLLAGCLWGCQASNGPTSKAKVSKDCLLVEDGYGPKGATALRVEVVADGLEVPWAVAFLPDGALLVTERGGRLRIVEDGVLRETPLVDVPIWAKGEAGLMGVAVHPDFEENHLIYLALTRRIGDDEVIDNRVERWKIAADRSNAVFERTILAGIPAHAFHDGGRLKVGPDRKLYVTTGDAGEPTRSQIADSLGGKVLRLGLDGEIPDDNPTPGSAEYLLGLRNPQGIDWLDPKTVAVSDHGPSGEMGRRGGDELNVATAGANLGWPSTWHCDVLPGMVAPVITWKAAVPSAGVAVLHHTQIPGWEGSVVVSTLGSRHLQRVVLGPKHEVQSHEVYFLGDPPQGLGRLREALLGPDGHLYLTTSNCDGRGTCPQKKDQVLRIVPAA